MREATAPDDAGASPAGPMTGEVVAVHAKAVHAFSKDPLPWIELVAGHGVAGDAHHGTTVKHRSRVARDPSQPNLRQVHLIHRELLDELAQRGFVVLPGQLGENISTAGLDLLGLPEGTRLRIGETAIVEVTGLRNPCAQIEKFMPGLLSAVLHKADDGTVVRKTGVMGIVIRSGRVLPGSRIVLDPLPAMRRALKPV